MYHLSVTLSLPELPVSVLVAVCTRGVSTGKTLSEGMYCNQFGAGTEELNKVKEKTKVSKYIQSSIYGQYGHGHCTGHVSRVR